MRSEKVCALPSKTTVFIIGPTASGKTELAACLAKKIPLEVISCDSMQIYKSMPIIAQSPSEKVRRKITHHLVAQLSVKAKYNAARFSKEAKTLIRKLHQKNRLPLVVGGTGLYVNALLDGIFPGYGTDMEFRKRLKKEASQKGSQLLYQRLLKKDPLAAKKIHPHDLRRLIRALEVIHLSGQSFSQIKKKRQGIWDPGNIRLYGLRWDRALLYERINARVDKMFRQGVVREVQSVLRKKPSLTASMGLGIREIGAYLSGQCTKEEAKAMLKRNTRRFAKRQVTWFKRDDRIHWVDASFKDQPKDIAERIWKDLALWKKQSR